MRSTMPAHPKRRGIALALAAAGLGVAGCGEPATVHLANGHVVLKLSEYRIRPQTIVVARGTDPGGVALVRIYATDVGVQPHNIEVETIGASSVVQGGVTTLLPGHSGESKVMRLKPGRYLLACTIADQGELGMTGELIVR
ncbi:MAG TPA: hypothetical protein VHX88_16330 [Solirubrobacteraceae bacterium]|jgi:uncharacterized cupredoxin-like copper-binding protein|nr:hypothetical protein [Solirubrobacteraceae bacterium]